MAIARFLRTCPGLSKSIVGDLLGQNTERCLRILDAFTHMFDFSGAASQSLYFRTASAQKLGAGFTAGLQLYCFTAGPPGSADSEARQQVIVA